MEENVEVSVAPSCVTAVPDIKKEYVGIYVRLQKCTSLAYEPRIALFYTPCSDVIIK